MIYVIGSIVLILIVCFFIVFSNYSKLKDIKVSIDTCAENISESLNKKLELVKDLLKKVDNEKITREFVYDENASLYEREDALFNVSFELNKYIKDENSKKKITKKGKAKNKSKDKEKEEKSLDFVNELKDLNILEENLDGLKDFYNANVLNYNEIFYKKPFNSIYKLLKLDTYKSFKIRKLEEYEIFKN